MQASNKIHYNQHYYWYKLSSV